MKTNKNTSMWNCSLALTHTHSWGHGYLVSAVCDNIGQIQHPFCDYFTKSFLCILILNCFLIQMPFPHNRWREFTFPCQMKTVEDFFSSTTSRDSHILYQVRMRVWWSSCARYFLKTCINFNANILFSLTILCTVFFSVLRCLYKTKKRLFDSINDVKCTRS